MHVVRFFTILPVEIYKFCLEPLYFERQDFSYSATTGYGLPPQLRLKAMVGEYGEWVGYPFQPLNFLLFLKSHGNLVKLTESSIIPRGL